MPSKLDLPREKLKHKGASALTDIELLQAIIGSGGKNNDNRQIAKNLNALINKTGLDYLTIEGICSVKGIGAAKAAVVFAALEYWRRKYIKQTAPFVGSAKEAAEQLDNIRNKKQEHFALLTLDGARRLINNHIVTIGTLNSSMAHPREIFALAAEDRAASIIIAHNHPSGILEISEQDRKVTKVVKEAGELMGIPLDDHIIVAGDDYISAI